jgi:hypothetical protein
MNGVPGPNQNSQQALPTPSNHLLFRMNPNRYGTHTSLDNVRNTITNIIAVLQSLML